MHPAPQENAPPGTPTCVATRGATAPQHPPQLDADPPTLCADCDPLSLDGLCYHCEDGCDLYTPPPEVCSHVWCGCPSDPNHWEGICIACDPLPYSTDGCHHCWDICTLLVPLAAAPDALDD